MAGFPTCECDPGYAAIALATPGDGDHGVRCREVAAQFEPERLLWAEGFERAVTPDDSAGCMSASSTRAGSFALFLGMLFGGGLVLRRALR